MQSTILRWRQDCPAVIDENPDYEDAIERTMGAEVFGELGKFLEQNGPAIVGRPKWTRSYGGYNFESITKVVSLEVWPLSDPYKGFDPVAGPVLLPVSREWFK